jgi:hypothetical protein
LSAPNSEPQYSDHQRSAPPVPRTSSPTPPWTPSSSTLLAAPIRPRPRLSEPRSTTTFSFSFVRFKHSLYITKLACYHFRSE